MNSRKQTKLVRENEYVAEVEVELSDFDRPWGPYLSPEDVRRLDEVRVALRRGDVESAQKHARVYHLTPVNASAPRTA